MPRVARSQTRVLPPPIGVSFRLAKAVRLSATVGPMASPEAKFAPVGALRGGLALMVLGALMAWGPVDSIPEWAWLGTLSIGALLLATALGIRTLRT
ncbi:hypothetical protein GCM10011376_04050 [Nocardioides flavus (ex Wang et al. 2016)]|uniref:Uncharacterized protein n=1 Tax=Nocardioides flavus (ex Wang et al. 2016) TaxID=2058780 RepID=A0ABQ3HIU2_9ACTN|nr:hypothetical protein GCM10011376_04050 [Nocardioides flavus (ex Wang et al. 2016)]